MIAQLPTPHVHLKAMQASGQPKATSRAAPKKGNSSAASNPSIASARCSRESVASDDKSDLCHKQQSEKELVDDEM